MKSSFLLNPSSNIYDAINAIQNNYQRIAIIIDEKYNLLGVITDSDLRRSLLNHVNLNSSVTQIMNKNPKYVSDLVDQNDLLSISTKYNLESIPILKDQKFFRLFNINDKKETLNIVENPNIKEAFIMAGGEGRRLLPLTAKLPKALIKIKGIPIIETIILNLKKIGITKINISVNYMAEKIVSYLGNGMKYNLSINFIHEKEKLGTCGSLSLLKDFPENILVMNCDLITNLNFNNLFKFHIKNNNLLTIASNKYTHEIPYGVLKIDSGYLTDIIEKPTETFFCNSGIYIFSKNVFDHIEFNKPLNMNELFLKLLRKNHKISIFPMFESWDDIGTPENLKGIMHDN